MIVTPQEREGTARGVCSGETHFVPAATDGETVSGTFTGTVQLSSGKFAIVEKSHESTLIVAAGHRQPVRS
jgi:hypothetical protein